MGSTLAEVAELDPLLSDDQPFLVPLIGRCLLAFDRPATSFNDDQAVWSIQAASPGTWVTLGAVAPEDLETATQIAGFNLRGDGRSDVRWSEATVSVDGDEIEAIMAAHEGRRAWVFRWSGWIVSASCAEGPEHLALVTRHGSELEAVAAPSSRFFESAARLVADGW